MHRTLSIPKVREGGMAKRERGSFRGKFWKVRANVDKTRRRKWDQVNETRIGEYNSQD